MKARTIASAGSVLAICLMVGCMQPQRIVVSLPDWSQRYGALDWELHYWDGAALAAVKVNPGSLELEIALRGLRGVSGTVVVVARATRRQDGYVLPPAGAWSDSGAAHLTVDRLSGPVAELALQVAARGVDVARLNLARVQARVLAVTAGRPDLLDTDQLRTAIGRGKLTSFRIDRLPTALCHTTIDVAQQAEWLPSEPLEPLATSTPAGALRHLVVTVPYGGKRQLWYTGRSTDAVHVWLVSADCEGRCTWLPG